MNWPNRLTVLRIILSPLFFVIYFLPAWTGGAAAVAAVAVAVIFIIIEISDVLDGYIARRYGMVTDLGKVIDPFADVVGRMTYFFCFTLSGLMPAWIFLVLLYRELGVTFLRMVLIRRGIAMAASVWGKAKAMTYALGGVLGVVYYAVDGVEAGTSLVLPVLGSAALIVFVLGAISSVLSFITYVVKAVPELKDNV